MPKSEYVKISSVKLILSMCSSWTKTGCNSTVPCTISGQFPFDVHRSESLDPSTTRKGSLAVNRNEQRG